MNRVSLEYRSTDLERWLAETLASIGSSLRAPFCAYEAHGLPPDPDSPILTRPIVGSVHGAYHRFVNAPGPLPFTIATRAAMLVGYPGVLEEDIFIGAEPALQFFTEYRDGRSLITQVHFDERQDHDRFGRLVGAFAHLPVAGSIEQIARADPEAFVRSLAELYGTVPNAYNALS